MLKRILTLLVITTIISFSACQNEGEELNPTESNSEYLQKFEIDGEIHVIDLTPPPSDPKNTLMWEHIGNLQLSDGSYVAIYRNELADRGSRRKYSWLDVNGIRVYSAVNPLGWEN